MNYGVQASYSWSTHTGSVEPPLARYLTWHHQRFLNSEDKIPVAYLAELNEKDRTLSACQPYRYWGDWWSAKSSPRAFDGVWGVGRAAISGPRAPDWTLKLVDEFRNAPLWLGCFSLPFFRVSMAPAWLLLRAKLMVFPAGGCHCSCDIPGVSNSMYSWYIYDRKVTNQCTGAMEKKALCSQKGNTA